jgi:hypothetical protein
MPRDETGVNPAKGIGALRHPPRNLTIELQKQRPRRPQGERGLGTEEGNGPYRWEPLGYWRPAASGQRPAPLTLAASAKGANLAPTL